MCVPGLMIARSIAVELYTVSSWVGGAERERELPLVTNGANVSREVHPDHSSLLTLPNLYNVFLGVNHVAFGLTTRNKKLLGAPGIATRNPGIATSSKKLLGASSKFPWYEVHSPANGANEVRVSLRSTTVESGTAVIKPAWLLLKLSSHFGNLAPVQIYIYIYICKKLLGWRPSLVGWRPLLYN